MDETPRLKLPLLQPSQAQKHVTLNEALVLLDGLAQLSLNSRTVAVPPPTAPEGACYAVPVGASADWAGQVGTVAIRANGGWVHVTPAEGWRAWAVDEGREVVFRAGQWGPLALSASASGAAARFLTVEAEHDVTAGGAQDLGMSIPAKAMVFAVSARVIEAISGSVISWRLGNAGSDDRFGSGMGTVAGSYGDGLLGQPLTYYTAAPLRLSPEGGTFGGGRIRVALHYMAFDLPGA